MSWRPRRSVRATASMCAAFRTGSRCTDPTRCDRRHMTDVGPRTDDLCGALRARAGSDAARPGGGGADERAVPPLPFGPVVEVGPVARDVVGGVAVEGRGDGATAY